MTTEANNSLLIGYGNECCGDDALGPTVVRLIDAMGLPDVNVLAVHQLMPELADLLASAGQAIFVDATRVPQPSPIVIQRLQASSETAILTHSCHPSALLALAQLLYGHSPPGWLVTIEGRQFNPGDAVSAQARRHADSAAQMIARWLQNSAEN
jgi:hydrogenase maturation protease